jgi:hypothetical protein
LKLDKISKYQIYSNSLKINAASELKNLGFNAAYYGGGV